MIGGVSKYLKESSKKVWSFFPIRLNSYSLLDFEHAKAEAATLEDLSLVSIEYKKHDPQRIVSTHLGNCGLKRFEHECSPSDDIFRGARSYGEVQVRIRSLALEDMASFLKFQENRKRCLPVVLRGLGLSKDKDKEVESSKGKTSNPKKCQEGEQEKNPEQEKNIEVGEGTTDPPKEHSPEVEIKTTNPPESLNLETGMKTFDPPKEQDSLGTPGKAAKQIGEPITSITPLKSMQGNIGEGWIFGEELRPIRAEELPPNEFFFDKKRKEVVKREFNQEEGSTAKKFSVMTDGKNKRSDEFTTEIAETLGAYASVNQFSVATLKNHLKRKNHLIKTLEA
jgi:hypothetical protein